MGDPGAVAAFFDVDGTLLSGNIVRYYAHFRTRGMSARRRGLWIACYLPTVLRWLWLDARDRVHMNRVFYRSYAGLDADATRRAAADDYSEILGRHIYPQARARLAQHVTAGERCVLLTGSLDFIVAPLVADLGAQDLIAVSMSEQDGHLTGELIGPPLAHEEKARAMRAFASRHGIDLARSYAYADSSADLEMLAAVGNPVVVNAAPRLRRTARDRGWRCEQWAL